MKLATFTTEDSEDPRYGFKKEEYIIDILYLSKFLHEKNNDDRFLNLPHSLKESLKDWNKNFKKFKDLYNASLNENLNVKTKDGFQIAQLESDINFLALIILLFGLIFLIFSLNKRVPAFFLFPIVIPILGFFTWFFLGMRLRFRCQVWEELSQAGRRRRFARQGSREA